MRERDAARQAEVVVAPGIVGTAAAVGIAHMAFVFIVAVPQRNIIRRILADRPAERNLAAGILTHVFLLQRAFRIVIIIGIRTVIDAQGSRGLLLIHPRMRIGERIAACIGIAATDLIGQADGVAGTAEIRIADIEHTYHAVRAAVAGTYAQRTRALLRNSDLQNHCVRLDTRRRPYINTLKEAQVRDALIAARHLLLVERLADLRAHFAHDHAFLRLGIALDLIALEHTLIDGNGELAFIIDIEVADLGQYIAVGRVLLLDCLHVVCQHTAVQDFSYRYRNELLQFLRRFRLAVALDLNRLQNRILQHIIGKDYALRYFLEARIKIIEISRIQECLSIVRNRIFRKSRTDLRLDCGFRRLHGFLSGTMDVHRHNCLAVVGRDLVHDHLVIRTGSIPLRGSRCLRIRRSCRCCLSRCW